MSFYKEELEGETKNYIHLRAIAERRSTEDVLSELVGEVIEVYREPRGDEYAFKSTHSFTEAVAPLAFPEERRCWLKPGA